MKSGASAEKQNVCKSLNFTKKAYPQYHGSLQPIALSSDLYLPTDIHHIQRNITLVLYIPS